MGANVQIDVWSAAPRAVRVADGFAAIVRSERVAAAIERAIGCGGWVVAATRAGLLIGYASIVPPMPARWLGRTIARRWDGVGGVLELGAIEIARPFRWSGVGGRIAHAIAADPRLGDAVLFAIAVEHHWDLAWSSVPAFVQRAALERMLGKAGMQVRATDEPEVAMHAANALFVRVGPRAPAAVRDAFEARRFAEARAS